MTGADDPRLLAELLAVATRAATAAARLVHDQRPDALQVETKSSAVDHVTHMDHAAEALVRELVVGARPHDRVVGEESGALDGDGTSGLTWWIDPIDGTTNYVYDHPGYAVSVAVGTEEGALVGVVADPTHARTYCATRGGGARCVRDDGRTTELRLGPPPPVERALVATGFAYDAARRGRNGAVVAQLLPRIRDIRRSGAAALDLCSVAAGRVDAYYEAGLSIWDLAAGRLVATEAGARVGALAGPDALPEVVLAAHPDLFGPLEELLRALGAAEV
ncbi:MAG: inositol monophosphatase family protein [Actinomycetes bacterium]